MSYFFDETSGVRAEENMEKPIIREVKGEKNIMFVPVKNKKVYQHVIEQIQQMVMDGTLKKGDKLPTERDLVEQLGVSRTSIREALRSLDIIGLVESRQGEGNFIRCNFDSALFEPLSIMFALNDGKPQDILQLRKIIEVESAVLAAKTISEDDKLALKSIMAQLKTAEDEKESSELDTQFHYKVAECANNFLILNLFNAIFSLMKAFITSARWEILTNHQSQEFLVNQHQSICDAIIENNPDKAASAMKEHLDYINHVVEKLK